MTDTQFKLTTTNCELDEVTRFKLVRQIEREISRFPDHALVNITILKLADTTYAVELSMKYPRGHVATTTAGDSLLATIESAMTEFKMNLRTHEIQAAVETFHFDKAAEYDYYTEISGETLANPSRKLNTLILEDDPAAAVVLKATLESLGCHVDDFGLPADALQAITSKRYDLLVLDWNLPYMKGDEFLTAADQILKKADRCDIPNRQIPVVICTSMPPEDISLPLVSHFFFHNHWHKSLPFSSVLSSLDETTKKITVRNHIAA